MQTKFPNFILFICVLVLLVYFLLYAFKYIIFKII